MHGGQKKCTAEKVYCQKIDSIDRCNCALPVPTRQQLEEETLPGQVPGQGTQHGLCPAGSGGERGGCGAVAAAASGHAAGAVTSQCDACGSVFFRVASFRVCVCVWGREAFWTSMMHGPCLRRYKLTLCFGVSVT